MRGLAKSWSRRRASNSVTRVFATTFNTSNTRQQQLLNPSTSLDSVLLVIRRILGALGCARQLHTTVLAWYLFILFIAAGLEAVHHLDLDQACEATSHQYEAALVNHARARSPLGAARMRK